MAFAFARSVWQIVATTFRMYFQDHCGTYAAAIAYYALFSLVPLSLVILSILGLVIDDERIVTFVFEQLPLEETESVRGNVREMVQRSRDISVAGLGLGVLALIWSSSGIFAAVRSGLNAASHRRRSQPYWRSKLMDFALIPCLGVLILLSVALTAVLQIVIDRVDSIGPIPLDSNQTFRVASYFLAAVISFVMFLLLYRYVPNARPTWGEALAGSVFATVLFEAAKNSYALVIALAPFSRDTALYAGFGTALVFLLWMFINASILLLGAEFGRAVRGDGGVADMATEGFFRRFV